MTFQNIFDLNLEFPSKPPICLISLYITLVNIKEYQENRWFWREIPSSKSKIFWKVIKNWEFSKTSKMFHLLEGLDNPFPWFKNVGDEVSRFQVFPFQFLCFFPYSTVFSNWVLDPLSFSIFPSRRQILNWSRGLCTTQPPKPCIF